MRHLPRRSRPALAIAAVGLMTAAALPVAAASWAPGHSPTAGDHAGGPTPNTPGPEAFTGLVASPLASPRPVVGAGDRLHLVYELVLTNVSTATVTIEGVATINTANGAVLASLDADAVASLMASFGTATPGPTLGPGGTGYLLLDASLPENARVPSRLDHEFTLTFDPDQGLPEVQRAGLTEVLRDDPVVIGPPLRGDRWIAFNGCCTDGPHRLAVVPINGALFAAERFAIDFAQLDSEGRGFLGDPAELTSFPSYGADVMSVARGVVVAVQDGIADNEPVGTLPPIALETIGGNSVVVDIGGGRYAFYGHLQPGSLAVDVGDHVRRGQLLGLLGNSGNSDFPHLHFHVMDSPSPLGSDGVPYEFRSFDSEGTLANVEEVFSGGNATFDNALSGPHVRRLPLDLQSDDFPRE